MASHPNRPELSLIVPLYNEAACMVENLKEMLAYLDMSGFSYELVLVNDGSTDATEVLCKHLSEDNASIRLISGAVNRGKGWAVKTGVLKARGNYIIFTDADLAVPIRFVEPLLKELRKAAPVVIGSRHLANSSLKVREGAGRQLLGEVFRRVTQWGLSLRVSDITCGFKGFTRSTAMDIFSRSVIHGWGYDAEILFLAQELGYPIREIPVDWYHSFDSKVKVGLDSLHTLGELLCIHYYQRTGRYLLPNKVIKAKNNRERSAWC